MHRRRSEEWEAIIEAQEASGLTVWSYCRREGLCEQSLRNHKQKKKNAVHAVDTGMAGFVEIAHKFQDIPGKAPSSGMNEQFTSITIRFGNGVSIEVGADADRETVQWLCGMIRDIA